MDNASFAAAIAKPVTEYERVKASKLRRQKTHTKQQRTWLAAYDARVAGNKVARASARVANVNVSLAQSTPPPVDIRAEQFEWSPSVPTPAPDEAPPPPGVEPPKPGEPAVAAAAPAPGDPKAAQQAALIMGWIVRAGIVAAMELLQDVPLPEQYRKVITSEAAHNEIIVTCAAAAYRVAINRNLDAIPISDEGVCIVAVLASAGANLIVYKRKAKAEKESKRAAAAKDANPPPQPDPDFDPTKMEDPDGRPVSPPPPGARGVW